MSPRPPPKKLVHGNCVVNAAMCRVRSRADKFACRAVHLPGALHRVQARDLPALRARAGARPVSLPHLQRQDHRARALRWSSPLPCPSVCDFIRRALVKCTLVGRVLLGRVLLRRVLVGCILLGRIPVQRVLVRHSRSDNRSHIPGDSIRSNAAHQWYYPFSHRDPLAAFRVPSSPLLPLVRDFVRRRTAYGACEDCGRTAHRMCGGGGGGGGGSGHPIIAQHHVAALVQRQVAP